MKNSRNNKIEIKKLLLMAVLGMAVQIAASFILTVILERMPDVAENYLNGINSILSITAPMIIRVCIVFPVLEELLFRGLIMGMLNRIAPFLIANITQALAFGIYHGNIVQGIYAFLLGLLIGFVLKLTGNIVYVCALHMSINALGMFIDRIIPMDSPMILKCMAALLAAAVIAAIITLLVRDIHGDDRLANSK